MHDGATRQAGVVTGEALAAQIRAYFATEKDVKAVYLFGSHARNDASRLSDAGAP